MSVYRKLDEGVPSEIHVNDLSRRRPTLTLPEAPRVAQTAENDSRFMRKAAPANEPFAATFKWIASLPRHVRPLALLQQFPRIANSLARAWTDPTAFRAYMFDLLIDRRGGRKGFPENVRTELLTLRAYFDDAHPLVPTVRREEGDGR